ncbi:hypothetical protein F5050DRAFT_1787595 [Lentinula boryana]|uniref:Uncharacterized protein n=1 Tax=Lentinula boryana TaxID=40481 RepID=A0ABQ8Q1S2_9AGAR|nr:hypothetical protein F5050DRAFT_1787595 [Lentinula boryana]
MLSSSSPRRIYAACFLLVVALLSITVTASPVVAPQKRSNVEYCEIYVARELPNRPGYLFNTITYSSNQQLSVFIGAIRGFRVSAEPGPLKIEQIEVPKYRNGGLKESVLRSFGKVPIDKDPKALQETLQTLGDIRQLQLVSDGEITDDLVYVDAVMRHFHLESQEWEGIYRTMKAGRQGT